MCQNLGCLATMLEENPDLWWFKCFWINHQVTKQTPPRWRRNIKFLNDSPLRRLRLGWLSSRRGRNQQETVESWELSVAFMRGYSRPVIFYFVLCCEDEASNKRGFIETFLYVNRMLFLNIPYGTLPKIYGSNKHGGCVGCRGVNTRQWGWVSFSKDWPNSVRFGW